MTLYQLFKRFLKDNDLYGYYFYTNNVFGRKRTYTDIDVFNRHASYHPENIIMRALEYEPRFQGPSSSKARKQLYSLSKKWRYMINKHAILQSNIEVGDTVIDYYGKKHIVKSFDTTGKFVRIESSDGFRNIHKLSYIKNIKGKDWATNIYIKDSKGKCYGKIDGDFNEVQL